MATLTLRLVSDGETRRLFPHDFALTVSVRLSDRLTVTMTGENTGGEPFAVTEAFHPYFAVADSRKCRVEGIDAPEYSLEDPVAGRALSFSDEGGKARHVWRPNERSHLSKSVSPIAAGDWRKFICVENGVFAKEDAYILNPGERHALSRTIRLSGTRANAGPMALQPQIGAAAGSDELLDALARPLPPHTRWRRSRGFSAAMISSIRRRRGSRRSVRGRGRCTRLPSMAPCADTIGRRFPEFSRSIVVAVAVHGVVEWMPIPSPLE